MLHVHQLVEGVQALERVATVEHSTLVHLAQVTLDVAAGECCATEDHWNSRQALGVEFFEIVAHNQRAFHEQTTHAEGIGVDFLHLGNHFADRNLDADVVHLVAIVGANDVDQVFANVVHVTFYRG